MSYDWRDDMETLEKDLGAWKKFENNFAEFGNAKDLQDKRFRKMKLAEMDRLWYKWRDAKSDPNLKIVAFQRRKLEASLYPGLTGWLFRMARRSSLELWNKLVGLRQENALVSSFSVDDAGKDNSQSTGQHSRQTNIDQGQDQGRKQHQGWDYGGKKQHNNGKGLGM